MGIGTSTPKAKLDVEGTMSILKSSTETNDIDDYLLTSDSDGVGTWKYNGLTKQNNVSSFNVELFTNNLFAETRFNFASENPIIRNELKLKMNSDYFALFGFKEGYYAIILNLELTNANSMATIILSLSSTSLPTQYGYIYGYQSIVGNEISGGSWLVNLGGTSKNNVIYIALLLRSSYAFNNWSNVTYWDKPWAVLPNGELFKIKGRMDVIKLG